MRRLLAIIFAMDALLFGLLSSATTVAGDVNIFDPLPVPIATEEASESGVPSFPVENIVVYQETNQSPPDDPPVLSNAATEVAENQAYLIDTASPGETMMRQGPALAIGRLHPEFASRLAYAIRAARKGGLPFAGIFSAYRPPAFGIGGFADKFNSLHTYGLAVDMHGIGGSGTPEAKLWHEIAARHGIVCPYGVHNRAEWNHCQPTRAKIILPENPLRETVTADGPLSLEGMFEVGGALIEDVESAAAFVVSDLPSHAITAREIAAARHFRQRLIAADGKSWPNVGVTKVGQALIRTMHSQGKLKSGKGGDSVVLRFPRIMAEENRRGRGQWRSRHAIASRQIRHHRSFTRAEAGGLAASTVTRVEMSLEPVSALPPLTEPPKTPIPTTRAGYRGVAWLARRHAVTVLPSVGSLASLRGNSASVRNASARSHAPEPFIGLGNPKHSGNPTCGKTDIPTSCSQLVKQAANQNRNRNTNIDPARNYFRGLFADVEAVRQICPLPETARELSCVAESVGARSKSLILGAALTETAVKQLPLDRYRIIHFATHGLLADETQSIAGGAAEPALVMTPSRTTPPQKRLPVREPTC